MTRFFHSGCVYTCSLPTEEERRSLFRTLLMEEALKPPPITEEVLQCDELLPVVPEAGPSTSGASTSATQATDLDKTIEKSEENTLRELRIFLRDEMGKIANDRKFSLFAKPVDPHEIPDYYDIIEKPMDLSTMMGKIDKRQYWCAAEFLDDIDLIVRNALTYNPECDINDKIIRHRALGLHDTAYALFAAEMNPDFERRCQDIIDARKNRGVQRKVPSYTNMGLYSICDPQYQSDRPDGLVRPVDNTALPSTVSDIRIAITPVHHAVPNESAMDVDTAASNPLLPHHYSTRSHAPL